MQEVITKELIDSLTWSEQNATNTKAWRTARFIHGEMTFVIEQDVEGDYDFCVGRGKFTDKLEVGAVKNPQAKYKTSSEYKYFVPETSVEELIKEYQENGDTEQEARKKALAYIKKDLLICLDPDSQGLTAISTKVSVLFHQVEIAREYGYTVEISYRDFDELLQVACVTACEAYVAANKKIAELKKTLWA